MGNPGFGWFLEKSYDYIDPKGIWRNITFFFACVIKYQKFRRMYNGD